VILELGYVAEVVHPQMEALKARYFPHHPDDPIIFHRKEMVNAKPPFVILRNPNLRAEFNQALLELMASWEYSVISVCIDKKNHKETYTVWRYDPYHYCMAVLLERFMFFLKQKKCSGDALAESRGEKKIGASRGLLMIFGSMEPTMSPLRSFSRC